MKKTITTTTATLPLNKAIHERYKEFLIDRNISRERSIEIEDLVYDDVEDDNNNYEILMAWVDWITRIIDSSLRFGTLKNESGEIIGLLIDDAYNNRFWMAHETVKPFQNCSDEDVVNACIDMRKHDLTQDYTVGFWDIHYEYGDTEVKENWWNMQDDDNMDDEENG